MKAKIPSKIARIFEGDARYRVAYGGRGSGKSWAFATMLVVQALSSKKRILCTRELQKSIKDSSHKLIKETIDRLGVSDSFQVGESFIRCHNGSDFIFKGLKYNPDEIKSTEGIDIAWVEEAHRLTKQGDELLTPTIRKPNSEIWYSFNPDDELDHVYQKFVFNNPPPNTKICEVHWNDNPWFPEVLDQERLFMKENDPETYKHVWQGKCKLTKEGSYYGLALQWLNDNGRITKIDYDAQYPVYTYWDIGKSDYTSIWFVQRAGNVFHVIDYYQDEGNEPRTHADMIKSKGYLYAEHILPHDAKQDRYGMHKTVDKQLQDLLPDEMILVKPVTTDKLADINITRAFLRRCYFDKERCSEGLLALKHYKKKYNEEKQRYEDKPLHDWASDGADAFRYLAVNNYRDGAVDIPDASENNIPTFVGAMNMANNKNHRV